MSTETLVSPQGWLSSHIYPDSIRLYCPLTSRRHKGSPSCGPAFTPPISLPFAPSKAASSNATAHHTRLRTPPSGKTKPLHSSTASEEFTRSPALSKPALCPPLSTTRPQLVLPTSQGHTAHVIFPPRRWDSLPSETETSHAVLGHKRSDFLVPASPLQEEPPSPATAKRKQYSKLRRHLGASIPPELVYKDKSVVKDSSCAAPVLEYVSEDGLDSIYFTAEEPREEEESSEESESEESGESEELEIRCNISPVSTNGHSSNACQVENGKWMREEGGRRWLLNNYEDVVNALREL